MVTLKTPALAEAGKALLQPLIAGLRRYLPYARRPRLHEWVWSVLLALALVAAMTMCLLAVKSVVDLNHVSSAYLIPVLIAAIRLGLVPAIVAAIGGVAASAFFFYAPIYDFRIHDADQLIDLPLFVIVAAVTSQLAARSRAHAIRIEERESEMRALYAFSKRLTIATDPAQIHAAIQDHLRFITGCPMLYFEAGTVPTTVHYEAGLVPQSVMSAVRELAQKGRAGGGGAGIDDERTQSRWLVRAVSPAHPQFGLVAIDVGRRPAHGGGSLQPRIDAMLADATATLERLDVARAIAEAKLRAEAETLGAAVMGSISHGLRTPLASIMGSASILVEAPVVKQHQRLGALACIVRDEAERLNSDIQRLLDASRISSTGVRPHMAWADAADIVNAAVTSQRRNLAGRTMAVVLPDELPLVRVDPVLIEQALGQLLDNAAKYSPDASAIRVEASSHGGAIVIAVKDEGAGLAGNEPEQIFERFYRGPRSRDTTLGSGLGLWIARAFVVACGGRLEASSEGEARGTVVRIILPEAEMTPARVQGGANE